MLLDLVTEMVPVELRDIETVILRVGLIDWVHGCVLAIGEIDTVRHVLDDTLRVCEIVPHELPDLVHGCEVAIGVVERVIVRETL